MKSFALPRSINQLPHNVQRSLNLVEPSQISTLLVATQSVEPARKKQFAHPERYLTDAEAAHLAMQLQAIFRISITPTDVLHLAETLRTVETQMTGRIAGRVHDHILNYVMVHAAAQITSPFPHVHGEIGVLFGGSLLMTIHALRAIGSTTKVVGIDPFSGYYGREYDPMTGLSVTAEQVWHNLSALGLADHPVHLITAPSESPEAQQQAQHYRFASLWIDGDHSYEGIKRDWDFYAPLVIPDGYVLIDNYRDGTFPGVDQFIHNDLLPDLSHWYVVANMSRSILLRKRSDPPAFRPYQYAWSRMLELTTRRTPPAVATRLAPRSLYPRRTVMTNVLFHGCQFEATNQAESYMQAVIQSLRAGERFLDIGSNEGVLALHAAERGAKVIAIETNPSLRAILNQNVANNQLQKRIHVRAPVRSSDNGTVAPDAWQHLRTMAAPPHVVRINYPGSEQDIITALQPLLTTASAPRIIVLEYQPAHMTTKQVACEALLCACGYELEQTWHIPSVDLCLQLYIFASKQAILPQAPFHGTQ